MPTPKEHQPSWRTIVLAVSSVSFAIATVLDLAGVAGPLRTTSVILTVLGFVALGASTIAVWITSHRRRRHHRRTAEATLLMPDDVSSEPDPARPDYVPRAEDQRDGGASTSAPSPAEESAVRISQDPPERDAVETLASITAGSTSTHLRLAGKKDLTAISEAGKDAIGADYFYDPEELEAYVLQQRDAVWCFERSLKGNTTLAGYAIVLALKPSTVERIKSGDIAFGRHILSSDIEESIDNTDAIYVSMVHGYDDGAKLDVGLAVLKRVMQSHVKRRPQLVLGREGSTAGRLSMDRLGFAPFGSAPFIEATYSDVPAFAREVARRKNLHNHFLSRRAAS